MWHHAFLTADQTEINFAYIKACIERLDSGVDSDNVWIAKLMDMAYEAGYKQGQEDSEKIWMQMQALIFSRVEGTA